MNSHRTNTELTPAERRAYAALRRDGAVDAAAEERTVAALRASGLFAGGTRAPRDVQRLSRAPRQRYVAIGAAAAVVVAVSGTSSVLIVRTHPKVSSSNVVSAPESTATVVPMYVVWY